MKTQEELIYVFFHSLILSLALFSVHELPNGSWELSWTSLSKPGFCFSEGQSCSSTSLLLGTLGLQDFVLILKPSLTTVFTTEFLGCSCDRHLVPWFNDFPASSGLWKTPHWQGPPMYTPCSPSLFKSHHPIPLCSSRHSSDQEIRPAVWSVFDLRSSRPRYT